METTVLTKDFYEKDTTKVAKALLGKYLVRTIDNNILIGMITETEAYLPYNDPASHSFIGKTQRNFVLWGNPGYTYVYSIRRYSCLNVVTESLNIPGSVLIRSLKPIKGIEYMLKFRGQKDINNLTNGPGKLCQALNITKKLNAISLTTRKSTLYMVDSKIILNTNDTHESKRIGISKSANLPLRFSI